MNASISDPVVWILGDYRRVAGLERHLPASWSLRAQASVDGIGDELVLLVCPDAEAVAALDRRLMARPQLVVLLDETSPDDAVADVLTAGTDACIRGGSLAILAGHLLAGRRRLEDARSQKATTAGERTREPLGQ